MVRLLLLALLLVLPGAMSCGTPPARSVEPAASSSAPSAAVVAAPPRSLHLRGSLVPAEGTDSDAFGTALLLRRDLLLARSAANHRAPPESGAIHVFSRASGRWTPVQELIASDPQPGSYFGDALALSGETLLAGAPTRHEGKIAEAGAAYVFQRKGERWEPAQTLLPGEPREYAHFGIAVALSGDTALIGAHQQDTQYRLAGAVHAFQRKGERWEPAQTLLPDSGRTRGKFGEALALDRDTALIGAPFGAGPQGTVGGDVYAFQRGDGGWVQRQRLVPPEVPSNAMFGAALALDGDTVAVGAPQEGAGAVYVFQRGNGWELRQRLAPEDGQENDHFGRAVALSGGLLLVGAPDARGADGIPAGALHVFALEGGAWTRKQRIEVPGRASGDYLGTAVDLGENFAVAGAHGRDARGVDSGTVYFFSIDHDR